MKRLSVTLKLEMEVPDGWEVVKTSDGIPVIEMGPGRYMDLAAQPLFADDKDGTWMSSSDHFLPNTILDMVKEENVELRLVEDTEPQKEAPKRSPRR